MARRTIFLPPIMQVLEAGQHQHIYSEGVSIVIKWVDINPVELSPPTFNMPKRPKTPLSELMKTIDMRDSDPAKDEEEHFSYIVCFPENHLVNEMDDSDIPTVYARKILTASGPSKHSGYGLVLRKHSMLSKLTNAAQRARRIMPSKSVHPTCPQGFSGGIQP